MLVITTKNEIGMKIKQYYGSNDRTTYFYYKGDEIAYHSDKEATLYLNDEFISPDVSCDIRKRAVSKKYKRAYKWLLEHYANGYVCEYLPFNLDW